MNQLPACIGGLLLLWLAPPIAIAVYDKSEPFWPKLGKLLKWWPLGMIQHLLGEEE